MFLAAEEALRQEGLDFRSVVRTWIYCRHIDADYAEFNRARTAFFRRTGVRLRPASTGIGGVPFAEDHRFCMGFHAVHSPLRVDVVPVVGGKVELYGDYRRLLERKDLARAGVGPQPHGSSSHRERAGANLILPT